MKKEKYKQVTVYVFSYKMIGDINDYDYRCIIIQVHNVHRILDLVMDSIHRVNTWLASPMMHHRIKHLSTLLLKSEWYHGWCIFIHPSCPVSSFIDSSIYLYELSLLYVSIYILFSLFIFILSLDLLTIIFDN